MIGVVDYGAGNLRSVEFALEELDVPHRRVSEPEQLGEVERVVLPGVGAAASAMRALRERGLADALRETESPLLGICLGMQLLVRTSDEGDGEVTCLGLLPGRTRRIRTSRRLPHIGWNRLEFDGERDRIFEGLPADGAYCYFLHGHRVECPDRHVRARTEYGERFPAALRRGRVAGLQFHPEKSGPVGLRILQNFCRPGGDPAAGRGDR